MDFATAAQSCESGLVRPGLMETPLGEAPGKFISVYLAEFTSLSHQPKRSGHCCLLAGHLLSSLEDSHGLGSVCGLCEKYTGRVSYQSDPGKEESTICHCLPTDHSSPHTSHLKNTLIPPPQFLIAYQDRARRQTVPRSGPSGKTMNQT